MNRLIAVLIGLLLAVITAQAALAWGFSYTGWGPMSAPLEGTHMISYGDSDMRIGAYGTDTQMTLYGTGRGTGDLGIGVSLARSPTYAWETQDGWSNPVRTGYSDWTVQSATANCPECGWGFTTNRAPTRAANGDYLGGTYSGVAYFDTRSFPVGPASTRAQSYPYYGGTYMRDRSLSQYQAYNWRYSNIPQRRSIIGTLGTAEAGYVVP